MWLLKIMLNVYESLVKILWHFLCIVSLVYLSFQDSDSDSSDDEDDTAALLAELNKIKHERAQEQAKREAEKAAEEERIRIENITKGNPLLNKDAGGAADFKVKRR